MKATYLSRYTPRLMPAEVLESIFVQRQELAQELVKLIRDCVLTGKKHHTLLTGPRGIGKTHLISLVYYRIRNMDDLRDRLLIAWLSEEEWSVTSFLDLLLSIFQALQEESKNSNNVQPCPSIEKVESLYNLSVDAAEAAGADLLKEFIGDRTLLVLVENLDELLERLGKEGQKQLRAFLEENQCTILATAPNYFNDVKRQKLPFSDFFQHIPLKDLTPEDATQLLANIAKINNNPDLESFIQTPTGRDRIKAVHHLAGGSHRLFVIFTELLTCKSLDELVEPFMRTLDELTPYYQERMRYLSPQQRKIIDFLCDRRHPVPVKEISQRCFISSQTASSQLKDLREKGYVTSDMIGRESFYELGEPLMRFCLEVKKQRGEPIRLFVDFLRLWYTQIELEQQLKSLSPDASIQRQYILYALQTIKQEDDDPRIEVCLKKIETSCFKKKNFYEALQIAEKLIEIRSQAQEWFIHGLCLGMLRRYEEALLSFEKMIELDPFSTKAWLFRGMILLELERHEQALNSFDKTIELAPNKAEAWYFRGITLLIIECYEEALISFDETIKFNSNIREVMFFRNLIIVKNNTYELVNKLLSKDHDLASWQAEIPMWIEIHEKYQWISFLAKSLVENIPTLIKSEMLSDKAVRTWLELWQELVGDRPEFQISLRLLNAAVRYRETKGDRRVLLELPIEERNLLKPLLGLEES